MAQLSTVERCFLTQALGQHKRLDGREVSQARLFTLARNGNEVTVCLGKTTVTSRIKAELVRPQEGRGQQGVLLFRNSLNSEEPQARKTQDMLDTLLDQLVKESKAISLESLSVVNQTVVWKLQVTNTLLVDDGNLVDAFYLASIVSLSLFRKAFVRIDNKTLFVYDQEPLRAQSLSINHVPIVTSFGLLDIQE